MISRPKSILFFMGHPAHFHLFYSIIKQLEKEGHKTKVLIKTKDVLEQLCIDNNLSYLNILPNYKRGSTFKVILSFFKRYVRIGKQIRLFRPDLLVGSDPTIAHLGWIFKIRSVIFCEDDYAVIPQFAKMTYPFASAIVAPAWCDVGKWEKKKVAYKGFQKLSYLHPSVFKADKEIFSKWIKTPFVLIRLSELKAHHDKEAVGISPTLLDELINTISPSRQIYISHEGILDSKYHRYALPTEVYQYMHHLLAFADLYIGDSQSMAVETALIGTPGIRVSSFKNEISVLNKLEHDFQLTMSFEPKEITEILNCVGVLLDPQQKDTFRKKMIKTLEELEDVPLFFSKTLIEQSNI